MLNKRAIEPKERAFIKERELGAEALDLYRAGALARIKMIKSGVPARYLARLSKRMKISKSELYAMTGLGRATVDRKVKLGQRLSEGETERVLGMLYLVGQAQDLVQESGSLEGFDAPAWVATWLDRPHGALGGKRPGEFMDTAEGRSLVGTLLARQQSGAYA